MATQVPALDSSGWLDGIAEKAEKLFVYWLASERSQSNMFSEIASFPYLLQEHAGSTRSLVEGVEQSLYRLFVDYFDDVSVNVQLRKRNDSDSENEKADDRRDLRIDCDILQGNERHNLTQLLALSNNTLDKVTNLNKE